MDPVLSKTADDAVITPVTRTSPTTSSADVGTLVNRPILVFVNIPTGSVVLKPTFQKSENSIIGPLVAGLVPSLI